MFFIVTTGRSGSMSLARILNQHPLCRCRHEPHPILIKLAAEWKHSELDEDEMRSYLAFKGERMFPHRVGLKLYGESDQRLSYIIPFLAEFGSSTKFIWLIRDGRKVVASMFSRGEYSEEEARQVPHLWAKYRLAGDRTGDMKPVTWQHMAPFEKCCWYWSYTNRLISEDLSLIISNQSMMVRLETLDRCMDRIIQFLDLPYYPLQGVHANKNYVPPYRPSLWSDKEKAIFEKWCGNEMDRWYPGWQNDHCDEIESNLVRVPRTTKAVRTVISHLGWGSKKVMQQLLKPRHSI